MVDTQNIKGSGPVFLCVSASSPQISKVLDSENLVFGKHIRRWHGSCHLNVTLALARLPVSTLLTLLHLIFQRDAEQQFYLVVGRNRVSAFRLVLQPAQEGSQYACAQCSSIVFDVTD